MTVSRVISLISIIMVVLNVPEDVDLVNHGINVMNAKETTSLKMVIAPLGVQHKVNFGIM